MDNTNDGAATYENVCVIGGVQGDLPAIVDAKMVTAGLNDADVYISQLDIPYPYYIAPDFLVYEGSPDAATVDTSDTTLASIAIEDDEFRILAGRKLAVMVRGYDAGSNNLSLRTGINPGGAYYYSAYLASNWSATASIDLTPELYMIDDEEFYRTLGLTRAATVLSQAKRPTGSGVFTVISAQIMVYPITRFVNKAGAAAASTIVYIGGSRKGYEANGSSALQYTYDVDGAALELIPHRYNLWTVFMGKEGVLSAVTDTLTFTGYVTPRWRVS